jgi:hypothetical protein
MYTYAYQLFDTLQPLLCIFEVAGSEQSLNHTMIDLCEIFNFHVNDCEYFSSGIWYHIVREADE